MPGDAVLTLADFAADGLFARRVRARRRRARPRMFRAIATLRLDPAAGGG